MTSFPSFPRHRRAAPPPPPLPGRPSLPAAIVARRRLYLQAICARGSRGKKSENNARVLIITPPRAPARPSPAVSSVTSAPPPRGVLLLHDEQAPFVDMPPSVRAQKCVPVLLPVHSCAITCAALCGVACLSGCLAPCPEIESEEAGERSTAGQHGGASAL